MALSYLILSPLTFEICISDFGIKKAYISGNQQDSLFRKKEGNIRETKRRKYFTGNNNK